MAKQNKPVEVVAIRDGLYGGQYRKAGAKFSVDPSKVSDKWMVPVDSKKARDFEAALEKRGEERDGITGERVTAGGVSEQLAVTLEENRRLQARVEELEAELAEAREIVADTQEEVKETQDASAAPEDASTGQDADYVVSGNAETGQAQGRRSRRRAAAQEG